MTWTYDDRDDATDAAIARHQQQLIDWLAQQGRYNVLGQCPTPEKPPEAKPDNTA